MNSVFNLLGGHVAENETDFGSLFELPILGQQGPVNQLDSNFMSSILNQGYEETNGGRMYEEADRYNDILGEQQVENSNATHSRKSHRHSPHQIEKLEAFFKSCPNPSEKDRRRLGRELGLQPSQVKHWILNKRNQKKMSLERDETRKTKTENEKLRADNIKLKDLLSNTTCISCGDPPELCFDDHHLRMENDRLKDEIERMKIKVEKKLAGKCKRMAENGSLLSNRQLVPQIGDPSLNVGKQVIFELVVSAMEEFVQLAQVAQPLWMPFAIDGKINYWLKEEEYYKAFPRASKAMRPGFKWEATCDSAIVMVPQANLVAMLMSASQWSSFFRGIVAKATHLKTLSTGVSENYDGALELMNVELHMMTPLIKTRETCIARFCRHHSRGIWAVVDVSLDMMQANSSVKFRKRPSGCLIQELPNGCSKITWIEHLEVEEIRLGTIDWPVIDSVAAFGAPYWLSILQMQCEPSYEFSPNAGNNMESGH